MEWAKNIRIVKREGKRPMRQQTGAGLGMLEWKPG
jgi:hypothetical protein